MHLTARQGKVYTFDMTATERARRASEVLAGSDVRQPVEDHRWRRPVDVRIEGGQLLYDKRKTRSVGGELRPAPGMLTGFLDLADAPDEHIGAYAAEFGVLGLCEHDVVCYACTSPVGTVSEGERWIDNPADHESLATWRYFSRVAGATLAVAQRLRGARPARVSSDDLAPLAEYGGFGMFSPRELAKTAAGARSAVAATVTRWLRDGDATLRLRWDLGASTPAVAIGGDGPDAGLFSALGLQLALACAQAEGLWRCDGCGRLHERERPPRPGQRAFCDTCRANGVPIKFAKRDARNRQRMEQRNSDG